MEVTNAILLDKLKAVGLVTGVIDYFDMTWPWHFDLRSSDGLHDGRFPSKSKWKDGQIGHQYFVDLMLGHKKIANPATRLPIHGLTRRVRALAAFTFLALLFVWSVNYSTLTTLLDVWRYPIDPISQILDNSSNFQISPPHNSTASMHINSYYDKNDIIPRNKTMQNVPGSQRVSTDQPVLEWVLVEFEENYTSKFLSRYLAPKSDPHEPSKTVDIKFLNFDDDGKAIVLSTGFAQEVFFQAVDESRNSQIHGGDYFEIDLAVEWWRSRPPTRDLSNGTYSFTLQVHPNFAGLHPLAVRLIYDKQLRKIPITFSKSEAKLSELHLCKKSNFNQDVWAGRWTRLAKNDECEIREDGRLKCLGHDHPCADTPGAQARVSTRILQTTKDKSRSVRITDTFNGLWNETPNYLGLKSLSHKGYSDLIKSFFNGPTVPDTIIFNSGLHDAFHWRQIEQFVAEVETAASFWRKIIDGVKKRGLNASDFIFSKAELFNRIIAEKLREAGLVTSIIDDFDMTWEWHFDLRCTDGTHYGRFPSKSKWKDGQIGHQYLVDLMLGHVLLNAICPL
ncbi:hypothetical protein Cgig2_016565 [Carnegiea gigantea]|uniref:Uncharacterized protein n=1 Tax=Carnegiea gigantea TaxID=171969 RepID=A0A9Q1KYE5_9CARY|nr:hypothetical protein Cgig2_016565 [Carnegiea gigantea]